MGKAINFIPIEFGILVTKETWESVKHRMPNAFVRKTHKTKNEYSLMCYPLFEAEVGAQINENFKIT